MPWGLLWALEGSFLCPSFLTSKKGAETPSLTDLARDEEDTLPP